MLYLVSPHLGTHFPVSLVPNFQHEAQFEIDDATKEPGTIAHVIRSGFSLHGRTVRAAAVGVVKAR